MSASGTIYLTISALIYTIITTAIFFTKKTVNKTENRIYKKLLVISIFSMIVELLIVYTEDILFISTLVQKLFLVFILLWLSRFVDYTFVITMFDNNKSEKENINKYKKLYYLFLLFNLVSAISIFISPIYFNNIGTAKYTSGLSVDIVYFITTIYIIFMSVLLITHLKKLKQKRCLPVIVLIILLTGTAIIQNINPGILLTNAVFGIIICLMYFTIENPDLKLINQLEYAKNAAEKANRAKSDFLSSMSHEIRTPLNAIVGLSEVIKNNDDIEEIHEDANDVVMASKNLLEIVNGILDISKIEADKMDIIESNYNPVETFGEITSLIESKLDEKNLKLNCDFAEDLPTTLYGDKGKLKQIISNILSNAIKYTEKGHIDFNVTCINEKTKCKLQIIISDTGRGIKPEQIDKIFNKFERAEEDMNSTIEGTGLGLAITKSLVEMMGGKILVHSTYGEGSKFTILLEQKYSKDEETIKVVKDDKVSYSDKKVLIVDDNKLNIKVASKILKEFELNINSCDSGFGAIEKIENNEHYDIIFMDIMMPKMSGVETLKKLKEIDNFNIPVVALTADAMEGKSTKYIEVGFNDYLSKPINKDELKRVLDKCLNGNIEIEEEKTIEEDPHIHRVIPITDEDIEMLNRKMAEDLAKQKEQEELDRENN